MGKFSNYFVHKICTPSWQVYFDNTSDAELIQKCCYQSICCKTNSFSIIEDLAILYRSLNHIMSTSFNSRSIERPIISDFIYNVFRGHSP